MRTTVLIAVLAGLSSGLCGCGEAKEEAAAPAPVRAQAVSVKTADRYDFARLAAEGMARDKAVYVSGWRPRRPAPPVSIEAQPIFPTPPVTAPSPQVTRSVIPPQALAQPFDRGGPRNERLERFERGGGRGFGDPGGRGGPGGFGGQFPQGFGGRGGPAPGFAGPAPATN